MKIVEPEVKPIINYDNISHVATCARVCYNKMEATASSREEQNKKDLKTTNALRSSKHVSMFRHATYYFIIYGDTLFYDKIKNELIQYKHCPYIDYTISNGKIFIAANGNFVIDNEEFITELLPYGVTPIEFSAYEEGNELMRYTFIVTTQISTGRELNRVSPNNIAEQSTRYVSFNENGIIICKPFYYDNLNFIKKFICRLGWRINELLYRLRYRWTKDKNVAREALPLEACTKVIYTYSIKEWRHILDLRYYGTTGRPHPNAKIAANMIRKYLVDYGYVFPETY